HRAFQEHIQRLLVPLDAGMLHGLGIGKARHTAGAAPEQAAVPRTGAIVGDRVARQATLVDRLAAHGIARVAGSRRAGRGGPCRAAGQRRRHQATGADDDARLHDTNAPGTGSSPSAWRSTAQCMASSPRMLAAALARSRLSNTGTAPR